MIRCKSVQLKRAATRKARACCFVFADRSPTAFVDEFDEQRRHASAALASATRPLAPLRLEAAKNARARRRWLYIGSFDARQCRLSIVALHVGIVFIIAIELDKRRARDECRRL